MQKAPSSILPERSAFLKTNPKPPLVCGIQHPMRQVGKNGMWMSDLLPHMQGIVDDVCFVRSMQTDGFNHAPAQIQLQTGFSLLGRPSMGAWLSYGLGSENKNLPSFVVLNSGGTPSGGASLWGAASCHRSIRASSCATPRIACSFSATQGHEPRVAPAQPRYAA
jgi:hypothetical protein